MLTYDDLLVSCHVDSANNLYPSSSSLDLMRCLQRSVDILTENGRCKTISRVISLFDDIYGQKMSSVLQKLETPSRLAKLTGLILEFDNNTNRTKDLFLYNFHMRLSIGEYSGTDEVSLISESGTTSMNSSSLLFARFNVGHDTLIAIVEFFFVVKDVILTSY